MCFHTSKETLCLPTVQQTVLLWPWVKLELHSVLTQARLVLVETEAQTWYNHCTNTSQAWYNHCTNTSQAWYNHCTNTSQAWTSRDWSSDLIQSLYHFFSFLSTYKSAVMCLPPLSWQRTRNKMLSRLTTKTEKCSFLLSRPDSCNSESGSLSAKLAGMGGAQ